MVMSIFHRITGAALYFGTLLVAWWLVAAASGPEYYAWVNGFFGSFLGRLILFGYTWALIHHMLGGIRHLIWDTGYGLEAPIRNRIAWATLAGSRGCWMSDNAMMLIQPLRLHRHWPMLSNVK